MVGCKGTVTWREQLPRSYKKTERMQIGIDLVQHPAGEHCLGQGLDATKVAVRFRHSLPSMTALLSPTLCGTNLHHLGSQIFDHVQPISKGYATAGVRDRSFAMAEARMYGPMEST